MGSILLFDFRWHFDKHEKKERLFIYCVMPSEFKPSWVEAVEPGDYESDEVGLGQLTYTVVLSDTEGDVETILRNLRLAGLIKKKKVEFNVSRIGDKIIHIIDTGDATRKQVSNTGGFKLIQNLREQILDQNLAVGYIHILGNHCFEADAFSDKWAHFVEEEDIFRFYEGVLFLHGYPTVEFLRDLWLHYGALGRDINDFNEVFRDALARGGKIQEHFRYANGKRWFLHDIDDWEAYCDEMEMDGEAVIGRRGDEIVELADKLGIRSVVMGHKPCRGGIQQVRSVADRKHHPQAIKKIARLQQKIRRGEIIYLSPQWFSDDRLFVVLNDVLGKGNTWKQGMLLLRHHPDGGLDIYPVNHRNADKDKVREFLRTGWRVESVIGR